MTENLNLSEEALASYRLLREGVGLMPVTGFSLLEITGEDRKEWLQGQCTNDLRLLEPSGSIKFCVCTPTGQLLSFCTLWDVPGRYLISAPSASVPALLERAETMVIMEDVTLRDVTDRYDWVRICGPARGEQLLRLGLHPDDLTGLEPLVLTDRLTWNIFVSKGSARLSELNEVFEKVSSEAAEIVRIESGIPLFEVDTTAKTLPPELGPAFEEEYISYGKGCYTGQEILMRIHSRGHTNKTWRGLKLAGSVQRGDKVLAGEEEVGTITSAAISPEFGPIATAFLRNEASEIGSSVSVGGQGAVVVRLPFRYP